MAEHEIDRYKVSTEYVVEDHAASALGRIESAASHVGRRLHELNNRFRDFRREQNFTAAAMFGVGFGLGAWVEKAKEAANAFEGTKRSIAGLTSAFLDFPKGTTAVEKYNRSLKLAEGTTRELDERGAEYAISLEDMKGTYESLMTSAARANMTQERTIGLTEKMAAMSKLFGESGESAAMILSQSLITKHVMARSKLGRVFAQEMGRSLKGLTDQQIVARFEAVASKFQPAAKAMSNNMTGALFKIRKSVEDTFRELTLPLFRKIGTEITGWSKKIREFSHGNAPTIERWSKNLVDAFDKLKSATGFLVDHWRELAATWAAFKAGGLLTSIGGAAAGLGGAMGGGLGGMFGTVGKGLGAMAANLGPVVAALVALKFGIDAVVNLIGERSEKNMSSQMAARQAMTSARFLEHNAGRMGAMGPLDRVTEGALKQQIRDLHHAGVLGSKGIDRQALAYHVSRLGLEEKAALGQELYHDKTRGIGGFSDEGIANKIADKLAPVLGAHPDLLPGAKKAEAAVAAEPDDRGRRFKGKVIAQFNGPITIQQKFDDVDPDRVWVSFKRGMEESSERRVQSAYADAFSE